MVSEVVVYREEGESKDKSKMQSCKSEGNRQLSRYRRMYNLNQMVVILCLSKDETTSQNNGKREEVEVVEISEKLSLRGSSWEFGRRREQRINKRMKNRAKEE